MRIFIVTSSEVEREVFVFQLFTEIKIMFVESGGSRGQYEHTDIECTLCRVVLSYVL